LSVETGIEQVSGQPTITAGVDRTTAAAAGGHASDALSSP
jgi:cobalt-zinc-cadmium resistance protein CzcA